GPRLVAVTVNVTCWPTMGVGLLIPFVTWMSALSTALSETLDWSLAGLGSASVCAVFVAVLTSAPGVFTDATRVSVADGADSGRGPIVHIPDVGSYVPCDGVAETSASPANRSVTTTPLASLGPVLVAVTVNVTFCPTAGVGLSTVFWMPTSAEGAAFSVATAESLLVFGSGSLAAVLGAGVGVVPGWEAVAGMGRGGVG